MIWPEPEKSKIPEGHYEFRLNREPELKAFTYKTNKNEEKSGRKIIIYAVGIGEQGEFMVRDEFVPWDDRYRDLCKALHVEHGRDIQMEGSIFEADIKHEIDKKDPTKSWPRIINIVVPEEENEKGDDVPF